MQSPGPPKRYLYVRGLAELAAHDAAAATSTIMQLRGLEDAKDDRTAQKAADALAGQLRLRQGDATGAVPLLRRAHTAPGFEYDAYALTLARALDATGDRSGARTAAREASARGAPATWRIDLERDRREAVQLLRRLGG
jgi:hypothetical protein